MSYTQPTVMLLLLTLNVDCFGAVHYEEVYRRAGIVIVTVPKIGEVHMSNSHWIPITAFTPA